MSMDWINFLILIAHLICFDENYKIHWCIRIAARLISINQDNTKILSNLFEAFSILFSNSVFATFRTAGFEAP